MADSTGLGQFICSNWDLLFSIRLVASFLVGAGWITVVTVIAERSGTNIGGFLGGVPATIVVSLFFVGLSEGTDAAVAATTIIPYSYSISVIFIIVYAVLAPAGRLVSLSSAAACWLILSITAVRVADPTLGGGLLLWFLLLICAYLVFARFFRFPVIVGTPVTFSASEILIRGAIAGSAIAAALIAARCGGPRWGGVGAGFPAVFFSTLLLLHGSRGYEFTRGMCRTLILSGMINVISYALAARWAYHYLGLWGGTATAVAASAVTVYFSFFIIRRL